MHYEDSKHKNGNKYGFTLIELVVVIAIVGILAAILIPLIGGFIAEVKMQLIMPMPEISLIAPRWFWQQTVI